jgi:CRP-like cAMP-binding protein
LPLPRRAIREGVEECPVLSNTGNAENRLLALLPAPEGERWRPHLQLVDVPLGQVIHEPGVELDFAFFPLTAIVSLLYVMENGASAEIAVVGNDGMVGVSLFMGGNTTPSRAVVQSAGKAYRFPASMLKSAIARDAAVLHILLRYTQALLTQMAQTAVCNRHHTVHQQFCRWLLLSLDRLPGNELVMTQELIANMLGVRRQGVNELAAKLRSGGAIDYRRGRILILDRAKLEACSCECYSVVARECARLLPSALRHPQV